MTEVAVSVAAKVAEYLVAPLALPFRYFWSYKSNVKNLENEVKKLEGRRGSVHRSVEDARRNGEEIEKHVKTWLDGVKNIIDEVWEFINEDKHQQANMKGCKGLSCTNLKKRYQHSKKAARLKADVGVQEEAGKFEKVSFRIIPEETWLPSSNAYDSFEARKSILMNINDALRNPDVNIVGIYGMGGIGKTTLAKEVAREGKKGKLFREIVFVEVSQTPDIKEIQQEVADKLGLELREESISGRARRLSARLKKEEKILLILDNIWESVNFEIVGIPSIDEHKGLKLLLTARSYHVLTNEMDCQQNFQIESLNEVDAWSLFKSIAGSCVDRPDLQLIALNVAKGCGGVPIAIVTIAKALRNKEIYEWNNALRELRNPSEKGFEGVAKEVYTCIKLSYNHLESEELKSMFLLCGSMGRTYDASIQDLLRYGIGMGFFKDINTMDQTLNKVHTLVSKLKASSLLLDAPKSQRFIIDDIPKSERFAMHDVVCVVARSITSRDHHAYAVIDDVIPRSWVYEDTLKNCTAITLHDVVEFPKRLELVCPQLKFLYMKPRDSFSQIPDNFFVGMARLQVLHLIEIELRPLPTSFGCLVNLQTLCLEKCKLGDVATIGNFKKLEILSFHHCKLNKLPEEIRQLISVRLLDLRGHSNIYVIPPGVFSSLTQLEALYMDFKVGYQPEIPILEGSNASIDELKHSSYLTTLEINIPNDKLLKGLLSQKLENYKISIGQLHMNPYLFRPSTSRMLEVHNLKINELDEIISLLKGIQYLELDKVLGLTNGVHDLDREGFLELKHLVVENTDCKYIIDSNQLGCCDALPVLESSYLRELIKLEKICNGQLGVGSFQQLRTITVRRCQKWDNIFTCSNDRVLPNLQEIVVSHCENMEAIFVVGRKDNVNNIEATDKLQLNQLRIVELTSLPQLKSFSSKVKIASPSQLTSDKKAQEIISDNMLDISTLLFNEKVAIPNLEVLRVRNIKIEKIWHSKFHVHNLTHLFIRGCVYLKEIFSASMITSFVQLQYLGIRKCFLLEEIVVTKNSKQDEDRDIIVFPQLNELYIKGLGNLRRLHSGNYIEFPSLKRMKMKNCPKFVEFLFDDKVGFPNLEEMKIAYTYNLKMIWDNQLADYSFSKLRSLRIYICNKLLTVLPPNVFERCLRLLFLSVWGCDSIEEIFDIQVEERHSIVAAQLRELHIYNLPNLKHVWNKDPQGMFSFENLQKLEVSECQSLKNLFPASVAMGLSNLEYLRVSKCGLENIVTNDGVELSEEAFTRFLFPKLACLELYDLPELRSFYPGRHTIVGPVLKKLKLCHCAKVKIFPSEVVRIPNTGEEAQLDIPMQPLFLVEEAFPYLEELVSVGKNITMMWQGQVAKCKLKILKIHNDESSVPPLNIIQTFQNLEELSLFSSSYKEIFSNEEVQTQAETVANLKKLVLFGLKDLKYMWKQDSRLDLAFQNLDVLDVYACDSVINLLPPSAFFQNLTVLVVHNCDSLINIMTSSTAKSLVQLIEMKIVRCKTITEVVGNQGDAAEDEIIFSKLKILSLNRLSSLTSFCSGNCTLEFPALEELAVNNCDKMKIFSEGVLTTPSLREATIDCVWHDLSWNIDLNAAIAQSNERKNKICTSIDNIASSSS